MGGVQGLKKVAVAAGVASALGALATTGKRINQALGAGASGARLARMQASPQWRGGVFKNRRNTDHIAPAGQRDALERFLRGGEARKPQVTIPVHTPEPAVPGTTGLHVTWLGHASVLVELDGRRFLLDPVWSDRCSPSQQVGPHRLHPTPGRLPDLAPIDAVVISHDHYDHLDMASIETLAQQTTATFVVPLGIGAHLEAWGVSASRIVELDWEESHVVAGVTLTCVESQHFSGRGLKRDGTLWASWVLAGSDGRVFFSGDTGYFDGYAALGEAHGPFDVSLMAVGAYDAAWRAIHLDPEEAVQAATELGGGVVIPIHWCTFTLAPHPWAEPIERLLTAADAAMVTAYVPEVGERVTPGDGLPDQTRWWSPA